MRLMSKLFSTVAQTVGSPMVLQTVGRRIAPGHGHNLLTTSNFSAHCRAEKMLSIFNIVPQQDDLIASASHTCLPLFFQLCKATSRGGTDKQILKLHLPLCFEQRHNNQLWSIFLKSLTSPSHPVHHAHSVSHLTVTMKSTTATVIAFCAIFALAAPPARRDEWQPTTSTASFPEGAPVPAPTAHPNTEWQPEGNQTCVYVTSNYQWTGYGINLCNPAGECCKPLP